MHTKIKTLRCLDIKSNDVYREDFLEGSSSLKKMRLFFIRVEKDSDFFTEDSKLYITPKEAQLIRNGIKLERRTGQWDNLHSRVVCDFIQYRPNQASYLLKLLEEKVGLLQKQTQETSESLLGQFSLVRLWNLSIVGSILFGMVTMTFMYKYLGQEQSSAGEFQQPVAQMQELELSSKVASSETATPEDKLANVDLNDPLFLKQLAEIKKASDSATLEKEIYTMVKGYPIENMVPYIAKQDRTVAAFMVAIAKKESNWGRRVPLLDGEDCYNYVGYRGQRERMGTGGHTCFNSPEDAVNTIAKRIATLVEENDKDTAAKMVIWKCGNSCAATGGQAAANKWISDVDMYFQKLKT